MAYELKDGQGSLWKNDKRETDSHPNARGQAKIGGVVYWVDAWTNETGDGKKYQTLKFKPKDERTTGQPPVPAPEGNMSDDDLNDLPF